MAIKTISQFDAATPASNDKILFEQNGEGKSTALADLPISTKTQTALDTKVNTANVLTLEEIQAATDLTGKVASARALRYIIPYGYFHSDGESLSVVINSPCLICIKGSGNNYYYMGFIARIYVRGITTLISNNTYDSDISYDETTHTITFPTSGWYDVLIVGGVLK